jgi:hypothetical protein
MDSATLKNGLVGLLVGAITVGATYALDLFKAKVALEVAHTRTTKLAADGKHAEFEYRYRGEPIPTLYEAVYVVRNTGRLPIRASDVVSPISLEFPHTTRVLDAGTIASAPEGLSAKYDIMIQRNVLQIGFELLNPGDSISTRIYLTGDLGAPKVRGRVVNLRELPLIDQSTSDPTIASQRMGYLLLGALLLAVSLVGVANSLNQARFQHRAASMWRLALAQISLAIDIQRARTILDLWLSAFPDQVRKDYLALFDGRPDSSDLTPDDVVALEKNQKVLERTVTFSLLKLYAWIGVFFLAMGNLFRAAADVLRTLTI